MKNLTDAINKLKTDAECLSQVTHKNMKKVAQLKRIMKEESYGRNNQKHDNY